MTQPPADAPVAWPVTPEMIAAGWDCLKRPNVRSMPTLGPGMGLKEAYLAMRSLEPRQAPAPRQEITEEERDTLLVQLEHMAKEFDYWREWDAKLRAKEGLPTEDDTAVWLNGFSKGDSKAPPVWPSHSVLRAWSDVMLRARAALRVAGQEPKGGR
jgi:hypothetical protein